MKYSPSILTYYFSNSLVIHEEKTKGIITMKKVCNYELINIKWRTFALNFRLRGAGLTQWLSICLPPMWLGFDSRTRRQMWVEFVVGSRPCSERFFSGPSGFPLSSKTNISKIPIRSGISGPP